MKINSNFIINACKFPAHLALVYLSHLSSIISLFFASFRSPILLALQILPVLPPPPSGSLPNSVRPDAVELQIHSLQFCYTNQKAPVLLDPIGYQCQRAFGCINQKGRCWDIGPRWSVRLCRHLPSLLWTSRKVNLAESP